MSFAISTHIIAQLFPSPNGAHTHITPHTPIRFTCKICVLYAKHSSGAAVVWNKMDSASCTTQFWFNTHICAALVRKFGWILIIRIGACVQFRIVVHRETLSLFDNKMLKKRKNTFTRKVVNCAHPLVSMLHWLPYNRWRKSFQEFYTRNKYTNYVRESVRALTHTPTHFPAIDMYCAAVRFRKTIFAQLCNVMCVCARVRGCVCVCALVEIRSAPARIWECSRRCVNRRVECWLPGSPETVMSAIWEWDTRPCKGRSCVHACLRVFSLGDYS